VASVANRSPRRVRVGSDATTAPPTSAVARDALRDPSIGASPFYAPAWVPPGEDLQAVSSTSASYTPLAAQLFGGSAAGGVETPNLYVEFQPVMPGDGVGSTSTRIRGQDASVLAPKDAAAADVQMMWVEHDVQMTAIVRGISQARAISILDALRLRSSDPTQGFDPGSAPSDMHLLGERSAATGAVASVDASFSYTSGQPADSRRFDFGVATQTHSPYPGYLRTWIGGSRNADGAAVEPDSWNGMRSLTITWPDGHDVVIQSPVADAATLDRMARSIALLSADDAQQLVTTLDARFASLPLLGRVALADGALELHGNGMPQALCLRDAGVASPVCTADATPGTALAFAGSALRGDRWIVFAGLQNAPPSFDEGPPYPGVATVAVPDERGEVDGWHLALAAVPASVNTIQVGLATKPGEFVPATLRRPSS